MGCKRWRYLNVRTMEELVAQDLENSADWRRQKAAEFPDDGRNIEAAALLERLANEVRALEGSALHYSLVRLVDDATDSGINDLVSTLSIMTKDVGFRSFPVSGEEFINQLLFVLGCTRSESDLVRPGIDSTGGLRSSAAIELEAAGADAGVDGTFAQRQANRQLARHLKRSRVKPPPKLPAQGIGPHVEIKQDGVIGFALAESLDRDGNHVPQLRALHPDLRELARELGVDLSRGNAPHVMLGERVARYAALIDLDLKAIDFRRLYAEGVRLANAAHAMNQAISTGDLPQLEPSTREKIESLLAIHGAFILATVAGSEAMAAEERYRRRPAEERQYRTDAVSLAAALIRRPDLVNRDVAEQMLGSAEAIGQGNNPERSAVVGRAMVRNVTIAIISSAIGGATLTYAGPFLMATAVGTVAYVGHLVISDTLKNTSWFKLLTRSMASKADNAIDEASKEAAQKFCSNLWQHNKFTRITEPILRRLAGARREFAFLHNALDWLKEPGDQSPGALNALVLIVDDDEAIRNAMAGSLRYWKPDCNVVEAEGGEQALELLGRLPRAPNLILLDTGRPGMTNLQLIGALRNRGVAAPIAVVGDHPKVDEKELAEHINGFLQKPFTASQFRSLLVQLGVLPV